MVTQLCDGRLHRIQFPSELNSAPDLRQGLISRGGSCLACQLGKLSLPDPDYRTVRDMSSNSIPHGVCMQVCIVASPLPQPCQPWQKIGGPSSVFSPSNPERAGRTTTAGCPLVVFHNPRSDDLKSGKRAMDRNVMIVQS